MQTNKQQTKTTKLSNLNPTKQNKVKQSFKKLSTLTLSLLLTLVILGFGTRVNATQGSNYNWEYYTIQKNSDVASLDGLNDGDVINYSIDVTFSGPKLCEWMGYDPLSSATTDIQKLCNDSSQGGFYITDVLGDGLELISSDITTTATGSSGATISGCQKVAGVNPYKNTDGSAGVVFCTASTISTGSPSVPLKDFTASYNIKFKAKYHPSALTGESIINHANIHPGYFEVVGLSDSDNPINTEFGRCTFSANSGGSFLKDGVQQILNDGPNPKPFNQEGCVSSVNILSRTSVPDPISEPAPKPEPVSNLVSSASTIQAPKTGVVLFSLILIPVIIASIIYFYISYHNKNNIKKKSER